MSPTPVPPVIPFGLASKLLAVLGALFAAITVVTAVWHGDHTPETITAAVMAVVNFVFLALGRYAQSVAHILSGYFDNGTAVRR